MAGGYRDDPERDLQRKMGEDEVRQELAARCQEEALGKRDDFKMRLGASWLRVGVDVEDPCKVKGDEE